MKTNLTLSSLALSFVLLTGCAQQKVAEQKVAQEIKAVVIQPHETVAETAREFIMKSKKLSDSQKNKLITLQEKTHLISAGLLEEIEKTKIVLAQTVLEPKMNVREFSILKKKLTKLEQKRMANSFKAISEARNIINPNFEPDHEDERDFNRIFLHNHLQEF